MRKRLPLALCSILFLFWPCAERLLAEEKTAPKAEAVSLEQIPDLLRKTDDAVKAKAAALASVVDTAVKAKRVSPLIASGLRATMAAANSATSVDAQTFLGSLVLPMEDEAVADAVGALREASAIAMAQREADLRIFMSLAAKRMSALTRDAKTPEEVEPVLGIVEFIQTWGPESARSSVTSRQSNSLHGCQQFLRSLSRILAMKSGDDASVINNALRNFLSASQGAREFVSEDEVRTRILAMTAPWKTASETAEDAVAEALVGRKPSAQTFAALSAYEEASKRSKAVSSMLDTQGGRQNDRDTSAYKALAEVAHSIETHHWDEARQGIGNVKQTIRQLEVKRSADLETLTAAWESELKASADTANRELREQLRARLAKVKTPADLETAANEITSMESSSPTGRESSPIQGISNELRALSAAWENPDPNAFAQARSGEVNGRGSLFANELTGLRDRIERDKLSQSLRAPELAQPPFAGMSREAAIESLIEKLAGNGQWRRLLNLLEARNLADRIPGARPVGANAIASVRSFLAAQNLELAEQWTDAAASYKVVLRNAEENTPVKEAALRLRTLAKEHPKEVLAASATQEMTAEALRDVHGATGTKSE